MHRLSAPGRVRVRQFLDRRNHSHPHCLPIQTPSLKALVGLHGREDRRVLTVLVDQELG